jgi:CHAT domain-containing protein/tetratricopeptide (TPR) repeat protein
MKRAIALLAILIAGACARHYSTESGGTYAAARLAMRRGDLEQARTLVERALSTDKSESEQAWTLRLLRGEILLLQHQPAEVRPLAVAPLPPGRSFDPLRVRQKYLTALVQLDENRIVDAIATLDAARTAGEPSQETDLDIAWLSGQLRMRLGKWSEADERLNAVVARASATGFRYQQARALNDLGMGRVVRGRWDEALPWFERVLSFPDLESFTIYAAALSNSGTCYARLGDFDRALAAQRRAVALHAGRGPRVDFERALGELGSTFLQQGDARGALPFYRQALATATEANLPRDAALWAGNLASANVEIGNWTEAERYNGQAKRLKIETRSGNLVHNTLNAALIASGGGRKDEAIHLFEEALAGAGTDPAVRWSAHAGLADIALATSQPDVAARHFQAALDIIEKTRSDLLKTDYKLSFLTRLIRFYRAYVDALVDQGRYERALEVSESSRGRVLAERNNLAPPAKATAAAFRSVAARSGTVLVSYWLGPARSYVWVVSVSGVQCIRLPPASEIEPLVRQYRTLVDNTLANPLATDNVGDRLYRLVVEPVLRSTPRGARLVIVPDGALHAINFETLPVGGERRHYLIDDVEIETAPGLSMLSVAPLPRSRGALLLVGDPAPHDPDFPALRYASAEIANVSRHFSGEDIVTYQGDRASPAAYRAAAPDRFAFVHFTAHAAANVESPLDSAVILSGPEQAFKLYARDVADVRLHAELVTVSACRSAGERAYSGEGLVGFAWAFLRAGASRVVAGLWDVDDKSTADLMDRMYARIAAGDPPARALRDAKRALLAGGGNFSKPYYWGPFQLFTVVP